MTFVLLICAALVLAVLGVGVLVMAEGLDLGSDVNFAGLAILFGAGYCLYCACNQPPAAPTPPPTTAAAMVSP